MSARNKRNKKGKIRVSGRQVADARTVNDLLANDSITALLDDIGAVKGDISGLVVVRLDRQGQVRVDYAAIGWLAAAGLLDAGKALILSMVEDE